MKQINTRKNSMLKTKAPRHLTDADLQVTTGGAQKKEIILNTPTGG